MKKYNFLIGVPRSGNTVISSVLNQNKKICLTANSPLSGLLYELDLMKKKGIIGDVIENFPDSKSYSNIIKNIFNNYYSDWEQEYIFDRGVWGTPYHLKLLHRYFDFDFKFLILRRKLVDVFASLMKWCEENPNNYINEITNFGNVEDKYNFLFNKNGNIMKMMSSTYEVMNSNYFHHIIWYDNFVSDPQKEISRFYDSFGIQNHSHDFYNIKQLSINGVKYNDSSYGMNMHTVRDSIKKNEYDIERYVPTHIIKKINDFDIP
jgi:hypothetical protein